MGVQPHSATAGHGNPSIDLAIEEVGHGVVVEGYGRQVADLANQLHVLDQEQIIG